jgi:hypothetical protein
MTDEMADLQERLLKTEKAMRAAKEHDAVLIDRLRTDYVESLVRLIELRLSGWKANRFAGKRWS